MRRLPVRCLLLPALLCQAPAPAADGSPTRDFLSRARIIDATYARFGAPFPPEERRVLTRGADQEAMERVLDARTLFRVSINPESRVKVARGAAAAELSQGGWRTFLVRVENEAGVTARLQLESPSAAETTPLARRWLAVETDPLPLSRPTLSGDRVEYRILSLYSAAAGKREARFGFHVGQGTQDLGFRSEADVLFRCAPAPPLTLRIRTGAGAPGQARFGIRDLAGRELPPVTLRALEDRTRPDTLLRDGQVLRLAPGEYRFRWTDLAGRTQVRPVVIRPEGAQEQDLPLGAPPGAGSGRDSGPPAGT